MNSSRALAGWTPVFSYDGAHRLGLSPESYRQLGNAIQMAIDEAVSAERLACAGIALNACLVPPDGGCPTEDERIVCERASEAILKSGNYRYNPQTGELEPQ